jgi:hypothetical protein
MFRRPLLALIYAVLALELSSAAAVVWLGLDLRHGQFSVTARAEPIRIERLCRACIGSSERDGAPAQRPSGICCTVLLRSRARA